MLENKIQLEYISTKKKKKKKQKIKKKINLKKKKNKKFTDKIFRD